MERKGCEPRIESPSTTSGWPTELKIRVAEAKMKQQLNFIRQNINY
ncbi:MAG: hypothetical protein WA067_05830 [Microgenomates group bacterium]